MIFKVKHKDWLGDEIKEIDAHNEENAAEAYCEYLFNCDPRDLDEEIFINDKKYRIYTEVSPNFCASKQ